MDVKDIKSRVTIDSWLNYLGIIGDNGKYLCPFHAEKNPSFMVFPEKNIAIDFHDKESYDHISAAQKLKGWSFWESVRELANFAGVNAEANAYIKEQSSSEIFIKHLRESFISDKEEILAKFRAVKGYDIPDSVQRLLCYFPDDMNHPQRGRLGVVWRDADRKPLGFSGRTLNGEAPKYKYSGIKETGFKKTCLFGVEKAQYAEKLIVVEGIWDALIAHTQSKEVVATGGIVMPKAEMFDDFPNLKVVVFAPDNDIAGKEGFIKEITGISKDLQLKGITVYAVELQKDLDEMIMGGGNVSEIFQKAVPISNYLKSLSSNKGGTVAESVLAGRATEKYTQMVNSIEAKIADRGVSIKEIIRDIAFVKYESEKEAYIGMLAKARKIPKTAIAKDMKQIVRETTVMDFDNDEQITVVHPACHVDDKLTVLGFTMQTVENDVVEDVPFWVVKKNDEVAIQHNQTFTDGSMKYVIDMKNRVCPPLVRYWSKQDITRFKSEPNLTTLKSAYDTVLRLLKTYVELEDFAAYHLLSVYVIMTYFHRCFHSIPFIFIYGPKGSGKSQLLQILEKLCFNGVKLKGTSLPAIADTIDSYRSTLIIDQAESLSLPQYLEVIGMIADSYTAHGGKRRLVQIQNGIRKVIEFETYSPKIFASIREIDEDIRDRCFLINMTKASREIPKPDFTNPMWDRLRGSLYKSFLSHGSRILKDNKTSAQGSGPANRTEELMVPINALCNEILLDFNAKRAIQDFLAKNANVTQYELAEDEKLLFEVLLDAFGFTDEIRLTEKELERLISTRNPSKERSQRWILSKLKQYNLITGIVKEKEQSGKGRKLIVISRANVLEKYEKYFFMNSNRVKPMTAANADKTEDKPLAVPVKAPENAPPQAIAKREHSSSEVPASASLTMEDLGLPDDFDLSNLEVADEPIVEITGQEIF